MHTAITYMLLQVVRLFCYAKFVFDVCSFFFNLMHNIGFIIPFKNIIKHKLPIIDWSLVHTYYHISIMCGSVESSEIKKKYVFFFF